MRKVFVLSAALLLAVSQQATAVIVTQWNFNGTTAGTTTPSTGAGTASLVGGTTAAFASGDASGGSSDPAIGSPPDFGWGLTTFPAASANNETAGAEFKVPTTGFQDVTVSFDARHSNSASRYFAIYYTTDGTTYNRLSLGAGNASPGSTPSSGNPASTVGLFGSNGTFSAFDGTVTGAGDDWFNGRSFSLVSIPAVNNNPNFSFRIVSSFDSGTSYVASSGAAYATTGTFRLDMVTISGNALASIPEPSAYLFGGIATLLTGAGVYRRRFLS